jgi:hypothetical protein
MISGLQAKYAAGSPMATNLHTGNASDYGGVTWYNKLKAAPFNWSFTCEGGTGLPTSGTAGNNLEIPAYNFAMLALINPNTSTGTNWNCYGHDVMVYLMNQIVGGSFSPSEDDWRGNATYYVFTTDWLLGSGGLTSSGDLTLARQYVAWMLKFTLTNGYTNPLPTLTGPYNSSSMILPVEGMRFFGNNYAEARFFYLAALPLTFNDTTLDDPTLSNCAGGRYAVCSDGSANSMHAYFNYFAGAILYDQWAIMEDPNVGWQAYQAAYANLPTQPVCSWPSTSGSVPCFGEQRGGEAAEGSGYGYSAYAIRDGLNAIWTAGYADPLLYGPQMSLPTSSWWDMRDVVTNEFLTGFKAKNGNYQEPAGGIAPAYAYLHTGDAKHYYAEVSDYLAETGMMVFDTYTGRTDRTNALLWPVLNTAYGGPAGTAGGCNLDCGIDNNLSNDIAETVNPDLFIALAAVDPGTLTPVDPRPSMPTDLYNGSYNQHLMVRSGFTNTDSLLSFYCENSMIDHEHATCGMFEIYSNNEYITKGRVTFDDDYNFQMATATQNDQLSIMDVSTGTTPLSSGAWDYWSVGSGGLWQEGTQAGLISLYHSELPSYSAMIADTTNQYNLGANYAPTYVYDVATSASRSLIYLRGTNQVVTYDRAATSSATAKAVYLNTTGTPTVSGSTASWLTQSGTQKACYTELLGGTLSNVGLTPAPSNGGDWEVVSTLKVDAGTPTSTQFLGILEWGAASFTKSATTLVQSTAGQNFDGALVGPSLVMFMRAWPATFNGVTYPASGVTTQYVADLAPNTTYTITGAGAPASATTDTAGVLVFNAAGAGNITVSRSGGSAKATEVTTHLVTQYKVPIVISLAAATLLLIGQAAYHWAAPEHPEEKTQ